jgi:Kef-type K+ transport system membrane component KefB
MPTFAAAPHHDILVLLVRISVLLLAARLLAEVAQRLKQPAVVGEILAGVILGPSLLSGIFPALGRWVVPQTELQGHLLEVVALVGALFLLLITGLETDVALIRRHARVSIGASIGGIVVPFATGYILGQTLPDYMLGDPSQRVLFSLFVATAMSISAIPVIAKVLMDLRLMRRDIGQAIIAAGMTDDAIGWMLLSIVLGLASSGEIRADSVLWSVGKVVGFLVISFTIGRWLVRRALDQVQDRAMAPTRILTLVVVLMFAGGAVTQALDLEAVFGAFVVGILLGQMPRLPESVRHDLERIALGIFAPIFFAVAGLKVNALALLQPRYVGILLLVIGVASVGKVLGGYVGARWIGGTGHWEALSFGAGMNARGAMEIIVASIGLSIGILSRDMFSIVVVMALVTSLMAPPALRWTLKRVSPGEDERQRLKREELEEGSLMAEVRRVLIPVRCQPDERRDLLTLESELLRHLDARAPLAVTLLTATSSGTRGEAAVFQERVARRLPDVELSRKIVEGKEPTTAILDEAQKDYDLLIVGSHETGDGDEDLFTSRIDELLRLAPCPTIVVRGRLGKHNWPARRILVPVDGSLPTRNAADLAFSLAAAGGEVLLVNVVERDVGNPHRLDPAGAMLQRQLGAARAILEELQTLGETKGARVRGEVRVAPGPEEVIVRLTQREEVDLVILGTSLRAATEKLYLGPGVERVLRKVSCPVVLLNSLT